MPVGIGPFGRDTTITGNAPPSGPAGSRYINPASRDYEQDSSTGQLRQMPGIRQRVLLALTTLRGSATVLPQFGVKFPSKMGDSFESEAQAAVRAALKHLTDTEALIRLDSIDIEHGALGRARITVAYTETTTGANDQVTTG